MGKTRMSWYRIRSNHHTLPPAKSREGVLCRQVAFIPPPRTGWDFPLVSLKYPRQKPGISIELLGTNKRLLLVPEIPFCQNLAQCAIRFYFGNGQVDLFL